MADKKISALDELATTPHNDDLFEVVDVSDTSMAATGTNKKIKYSNIGGGNVTKVATPVNNELAVWTGDGTLEGEHTLTFNSSTDELDFTSSVNDGTVPMVNINADATGSRSYAVVDITNDSSSGVGLKITHTDASNSQGLIRLDGPNPEIEYVETDQSTPAGKWETRVQGDKFQINSRNSGDSSFEKLVGWQRTADGGTMQLVDTSVGEFHDWDYARFSMLTKGGATNYFAISSSDDGGGEGVPDGDIFIVDENGRIGINVENPATPLHVDQTSSSAALPVITVDQADVDEAFAKFIGSSASGNLTRSFVDYGDEGSSTQEGWLKIEIDDVGNQVADGDYYIPFYSLSA